MLTEYNVIHTLYGMGLFVLTYNMQGNGFKKKKTRRGNKYNSVNLNIHEEEYYSTYSLYKNISYISSK